jgi:hypothetical protein
VSRDRAKFPSRALLSVCLVGVAVHGQIGDPDEVRKLPVWPGSAEAARRVQGAFVFRDGTGEIVVSYPDPANPEVNVTFRFRLQYRVDPRISVMLSRMSDGRFSYRYTLANGPGAKTSIWAWRIVAPPLALTTVAHPVWQGSNFFQMVNAPQLLLRHADRGANLAWTDAKAAEPIEPGRSLDEFEVVSPLRPGLVTAYVSGREEPITVPENTPDAVDKEIMVLEKPGVVDRAAITVGPRFPPELGPGEVLSAFRQDIEDLVGQGLLDNGSALTKEVERAAAAAQTSSDVSVPNPTPARARPIEREILDAVRMSLSPQK